MAAATQPGARAHFHLLGFPVHIGWGFIIFMILLAVIPRQDQAFGYWLAGGVAGFTLLHELGHAVVARRAGAKAAISLEFMAGYTSYEPTRPISRPWTVAITFAGPLVHIVAGVAVLGAMGVNPLDPPTVGENPAGSAIWWAGPVIGALNLLPVLPLDGGHIVSTGLDKLSPGNGHKIMAYLSVTLTACALASAAFYEPTRRFSVFIAFVLVIQLASLSEVRGRASRSPFDDAAAAARAGSERKAVRIVTRALERPSPHRVVPAELTAAPDDALARVIAALPRPLPRGNPWNEYLLAALLIRFGEAREAADYAAATYADEPAALPATAVARAAAALGDAPTAAGWLRAARDNGLPDDQLRALVLASPEFSSVRSSPEVARVVALGGEPSSDPRRR